eukprot:7234254-Ditylum_brightwellii.AAC.2
MANKGRTMMHQANLNKVMRYKLFPKAFATATLLDGLGMVDIKGMKKSHFEHFAGALPKFAKHLYTWGKAGTIKTHKKTSPKIEDHGVVCMMVGYATNHKGDCYEMYGPIKGYVYGLGDVIWLKQKYYPKQVSHNDNESNELMSWPEDQDPNSTNIVTADQGGENEWIDEDADVTSKGEKDEDANVTSKREKDGVIEMEDDLLTPPQVLAPSVTQSGQFSHLPQYILDNYQYIGDTGNMEYEIKFTPAEEKFYKVMHALNKISCLTVDRINSNITTEMGLVGLATGKVNHTSQLHDMNYEDAMATNEAEEWDKSDVKEHNTFLEYKVLQAIKKSRVPAGAKVLTSTWAMKPKANGDKMI